MSGPISLPLVAVARALDELLSKDSLDMTEADRDCIVDTVRAAGEGGEDGAGCSIVS